MVRIAKDEETCQNFLEDILTSSEIRMIKRRWHIACLLDEGKSIRAIAEVAKVGTDTVERIARKLDEGRGGLAAAVEMVRHRRSKLAKQVTKAAEGEAAKGLPRWVFGQGK